MSLVLSVEILGEYKNLTKATQGAQDTIGKLGTKFATVGKNVAKVAAGIGLGLGAAVASQIKPAIDAASDLGESINAVNVSFGEAAQGVLALGENASRGLGLSKNELFGISVQFSNFAKTIAGEGGDVVGVVDEISKRGADFASVFNLDVSDALAKFQSGLAGQSEPLRAFGIDLSAANVEAYALDMGLGTVTKTGLKLTEAEKVMARYKAIMEQTAITSGDFANTSDSLANQQRITQATIEDLRAEIGEQLLPVMNTIMTFILEEVVPAFKAFYDSIMDPSSEAQAQFKAIGEAFTTFVGTFKAGSADVKSGDVFKWIGDSIVSVMRMLTHLSVYSREVFGGIADVLNANSVIDVARGIQRIINAAGMAAAEAGQIRFSDEYPDAFPESGADAARSTTINMNFNRAVVDPNRTVEDINKALRAQGLAGLTNR